MNIIKSLQESIKGSGGQELIAGLAKFAKTYSGPALTVVGCGLGGYAIYKAIKLAPEAVKAEEEASIKKAKEIDPETDKKATLGKMEKIQVLGPVYKPVIIAGTLALAAVLAGQYCSYKQMVVATGALAVATNKETLEKVKEEAQKQMGGKTEVKEEKQEDIRTYAMKRPSLHDKVWMFEPMAGGLVYISLSELDMTLGEMNRMILEDNACAVNDFYNIVEDYFPEARHMKCELGHNNVWSSNNLRGGAISYQLKAGSANTDLPPYWIIVWSDNPENE